MDLNMSDDILDNGFDYSQIPLPKINRNPMIYHESFALTRLVAEHRERQYKSLDHFINKVSVSNEDETFALTDLVRGQLKSPSKRRKMNDEKPIVFVKFNKRNPDGKPKMVMLRALLDSGGSGTLVVQKYAEKLKPAKNATKTQWKTPNGNFATSKQVRAMFCMPELHSNKFIEWNVHVTKDLGAYDMIIGRDVLQNLGIDLRFSDSTVEWDGAEIPFKDIDSTLESSFHIADSKQVDDSVERLKKILDAKYEAADLDQVADSAEHLSPEEKEGLRDLLYKHERLFDGTLGQWKGEALEIELLKDAKPYHARAFPIPKVHTDSLKLEVDRLCSIGVLKKVNRSEWAAPTFIIPKKDGSVRFISDFRELNKRIKRKPFPIPKIQDLLIKLEGFQHATSLDLNMGYYHIELSPDSKKLCTIVMPFGKYEYQRLPMGLSNSPDLFQEKMSELLADLDYVRVYIDDLLTLTSGSFADHLEKLDEVLSRLSAAGLKVNVTKSFFGKTELEYLGYWITRDGIQPLPNKVEAIQRIAEPKTRKELRSFIGIVNYYRDMWHQRSHILAPLAALTSKTTKWKWTEEHAEAFRKMKKVIAKEVLLAYPDFSKPFVLHTDASATQLGAVISQDGKPIAFYSRKLNSAQTRYTTTERELLSIVETLKEFRNILLGQKIVVHTDHKNLTFNNFNTDRVMRWRLIIEEYGPELHYIKGEHNVVADALSRLDMMSYDDFQREKAEHELFAFDVEDLPTVYPLSYAEISEEQRKDDELQERYLRLGTHQKKTFVTSNKSFELITKRDKIVLPKTLQRKAVEWYHETLLHPGESQTELTIAQHFHWHDMRKTVVDVCSKCNDCQVSKKRLRKLGHLPPKEPNVVPWKTLCIDLIGPYKFGKPETKNKKGKVIRPSTEMTLHCLTMIDPATGWFEIVEVPTKQADDISNLLQRTWLDRYPWPEEVIMDRGREFMAEVTDMLKNEYGLQINRITTRNPQANAMVERAHKTLGDRLRSRRILDKDDLPNDEWAGVLSALAFAMRATVHTTTRATPSQLVFSRDAIRNVPYEADWLYIKERKKTLILKNNKRENAKRVPYEYKLGDQVLVAQEPNRKFGADRYSGPHEIVQVNDNGTIRLKQTSANGGAVYQTWNIRNVVPYKA